MAIALGPDERRELEARLASTDAIGLDAFSIVQRLAVLVAAGNAAEAFPTDVHELLIRARAQREAFGPSRAILEGLLRERGLFPYLDRATLSWRDLLALEIHRPADLGGSYVFHREQANVYHRLLQGESVALSAPTSFGKSLIIDAVVAGGQHEKIAVIVPTIALIDETRRRLAKRFGDGFKVVTHAGQASSQKTIYVLTPERVPEVAGLDQVTFFVVDEFYKLDPQFDPERSAAVNEAFYRLQNTQAAPPPVRAHRAHRALETPSRPERRLRTLPLLSPSRRPLYVRAPPILARRPDTLRRDKRRAYRAPRSPAVTSGLHV